MMPLCRNAPENPTGIETIEGSMQLAILFRCRNAPENPTGIETYKVGAVSIEGGGRNAPENPTGIETSKWMKNS